MYYSYIVETEDDEVSTQSKQHADMLLTYPEGKDPWENFTEEDSKVLKAKEHGDRLLEIAETYSGVNTVEEVFRKHLDSLDLTHPEILSIKYLFTVSKDCRLDYIERNSK
jgi:hypothetical protein